MENARKLYDMVDKEAFTALFENITGVYPATNRVISLWADAKSQNPTIMEIFKDSLIIGVPSEPLPFDKKGLESEQIKSIFEEIFTPLVERMNTIFKRYPELEEQFLSDPYDELPSLIPSPCIRRWSLEDFIMMNQTNTEYPKEDLNTIIYWAIIQTDWSRITASFLNSSHDLFTYSRNFLRHIVEQQKDEMSYRFVGRGIKKMFGKQSKEFQEYDALLTKLSVLKTYRGKDADSQSMLCLSIHPKDFVGASKGNSWDTCFRPSGEYASSTSATMTSRDTIVAYTIPKQEYITMMEDESYLPLKYWRSFVLINPEQMFLMKGYPHQSVSLFKQITEIIKSLAKPEYRFTPPLPAQDYAEIENNEVYLDTDVASDTEYTIGTWYTTPEYKQHVSPFATLEFAADPFYWDNGRHFTFRDSGTDAMFSWELLVCCDNCGEGLHEGDECYDDETEGTYCWDCLKEIEQSRQNQEDDEDAEYHDRCVDEMILSHLC